MAFITPVSGGSQPVFATDVLNGPIAQDANIAAQGPTNFQGPKLDFSLQLLTLVLPHKVVLTNTLQTLSRLFSK